MSKKPSRLHWLLPVIYALPIVAAAVGALCVYGQQIVDLLMIAMKMVVIA